MDSIISDQMPSSAIPKLKGVVDIIFLIDSTGSMSPEIEAIKKHVGNFLDSLKKSKSPNDNALIKDWRAAVYGYRDHDFDTANGLPWFITNPFTRDINEVRSQLNELKATGGGPEPESLLDALLKIAELPSMAKGTQMSEEDPKMWRYSSDAARAVIVFTDATFHEEIPSCPGATIEDVKNNINQKRIRLNVFAPEFMEFSGYEDLGECDKCEFIPVPLDGLSPIKALEKYMSNDNNFSEVLKNLGKTITQTALADIKESENLDTDL